MSIVNRTLGAGYCTATEVREQTGLSSANDISDADLNKLIVSATLKFAGDVSIRAEGVVAAVKDSARTVFQLPFGLIADLDADGDVDGDDLIVRFIKTHTDGTILSSATGLVTVNSAEFGVITTANALPADYECVVDYAHYSRILDFQRAKRAVIYLAAHLAWVRVKAPGRITRADLTGIGRSDADDGSREAFWFKLRTRWFDLYRKEVAAIVSQPVV